MFELDEAAHLETATNLTRSINLGSLDFHGELLDADANQIASFDDVSNLDLDLAPGEYEVWFTLLLLLDVSGEPIGQESAEVVSTATFTAAGANPIPLPPAVWSGMLAMGLSCVGPIRRRLRR